MVGCCCTTTTYCYPRFSRKQVGPWNKARHWGILPVGLCTVDVSYVPLFPWTEFFNMCEWAWYSGQRAKLVILYIRTPGSSPVQGFYSLSNWVQQTNTIIMGYTHDVSTQIITRRNLGLIKSCKLFMQTFQLFVAFNCSL